jgi:hypothetical protein
MNTLRFLCELQQTNWIVRCRQDQQRVGRHRTAPWLEVLRSRDLPLLLGIVCLALGEGERRWIIQRGMNVEQSRSRDWPVLRTRLAVIISHNIDGVVGLLGVAFDAVIEGCAYRIATY